MLCYYVMLCPGLCYVYYTGKCSFTQGHRVCMQGSSSGIMDALWPKDSQGHAGIFKHTLYNAHKIVYYILEVEDYQL